MHQRLPFLVAAVPSASQWRLLELLELLHSNWNWNYLSLEITGTLEITSQ